MNQLLKDLFKHKNLLLIVVLFILVIAAVALLIVGIGQAYRLGLSRFEDESSSALENIPRKQIQIKKSLFCFAFIEYSAHSS